MPRTPQTSAQRARQEYRKSDGKYSINNPCYRCGKSAGDDYCSFLADTDDSLGNEWNDTALCLCDHCGGYMEEIYAKDPAAALG